MIILLGSLLVAGIATLQSTLLSFLAIADVQPDILLIVVIFVANRNGAMAGQIVGLVGGIVLDILGLAPIGFYGMIYAIIGAAFGITRGKVFVDPVFIPVLLAVVGLLIKGLVAAILGGLFGLDNVSVALISSGFLIEIGYSAILSPVFFGILSLIRWLQPDRRRGEVV